LATSAIFKQESTAVDRALRLDPNLSLTYAVRGEAQLDVIPSRGAVGWEDSSGYYLRAISMTGKMPRRTRGSVQTTPRALDQTGVGCQNRQ
jgi:hypothetical protein